MLSGSSDLARSSLRISHDGEFYRRLLSRETTSPAVPSFRACDCAVPFMWESRPGTPKHPSQEAALPPLTPPPSYQSSPMSAGAAGAKRHPFKAGFLGAVLPRLARRKQPRATPTTLPMQASPDTSLSPVGSCGGHHGRGRCRLPIPASSSPFACRGDDGESSTAASHAPCFGARHGGLRGCCSVVIRKNAFHLPWM